MLLFDMMTIGNRLLAARKRLGLTQAEEYADRDLSADMPDLSRLPGRHPDGGAFLGGPAAGGAFAAAGSLQSGPAGDGSAAFGGVSAFPVREGPLWPGFTTDNPFSLHSLSLVRRM
mgnify:CR=1 FL=1